MSSSRELLESTSAVIDAWLLQSGAGQSVQSLRGALDVGGRALLSASDEDQPAAEKYRRSLVRLQQELPAIEERINRERSKLVADHEALNRAARWLHERRELV